MLIRWTEDSGLAPPPCRPYSPGTPFLQIKDKRIFTERTGLRRSHQRGHRNGLVAQGLPEGK